MLWRVDLGLEDESHMPRLQVSTSMGIAFTILIAGIVVQITDTLQLFGRDSVVPLIIGLVIIVIGVAFFLIRRWRIRHP